MTARILHFLKSTREYGVVVILLALHVICISLPGREAKLASSNLMTNLSRLEALPKVTKRTVVLAGSSITGRLLEEYFTLPDQPIHNLGLDGCGSLEALRTLLTARQLPAVILVELNTLKPGFEKTFEQVMDAHSPRREQAAHLLPFLRSRERPLDVLYDFTRSLKKEATTSQGGHLKWNDAIRVLHPPLVGPPPPPTAKETAYLESARATLTRLRQAGCKLAFVLIADSLFYDPWHDPNFARAAEIGTPLDIPIFDLRKATGIESLSWTDAIHLTAPAARTMAQFIEKEIIPLAK
jgi:hypothetical protein